MEQKKILLVENDSLIAAKEKQSLEEHGYKVVLAHSGEESIVKVASDPDINLILMGILLGGGIDGIDAAEKILEKHEIPIVFLSNHSEPDLLKRIEGVSSYGYVPKNTEFEALNASIKIALSLYEKRSAKIDAEKQSLFESEVALLEKLNEAQKLAQIGSWDWDLNTNKVWWSDETYRIFGVSQDEYVPSFDGNGKFIHPDDLGMYAQLFENSFRTGEPLNYDFRLIAGDGKMKICNARGNIKYDANGKKKSFIGTVHDITDMKIVEDSLRESERNFRALFEQAAVGVAKIETTTGRFVAVNARYCNIVGYNENELKSMSFRDILHPEDVLTSLGHVERFMRNEITEFSTEKRYIHKSGAVVWVRLTVAPLWESGENPDFNVSVIEDISSRKLAEFEKERMINELRKLNAEMDAVFNVIPFLLSIHSPDGKYLRVNRAMIELFGLDPVSSTREEIAFRLNAHFPDGTLLTSENMPSSRTLKGETVSNVEYIIINRAGEERNILFSGYPLMLDGRVSGAVFAQLDITDRKKDEEKIRTLLAEKELILKEVHHRIKNYMGTIRGLLYLQAGYLKDKAAISALKEAGMRVQSMMVLYDKLYMSPNYDRIDVQGYISSLVFQIVDNFPNKDIVKVKMNLDQFSLSSKILNPVGIIINELITNAMKYAFVGRKEGIITVFASLKDDFFTFSVEDNGIGLPNCPRNEYETGLGLVLVESLTEQVKGSTHIESCNGTKVTVKIKV